MRNHWHFLATLRLWYYVDHHCIMYIYTLEDWVHIYKSLLHQCQLAHPRWADVQWQPAVNYVLFLKEIVIARLQGNKHRSCTWTPCWYSFCSHLSSTGMLYANFNEIWTFHLIIIFAVIIYIYACQVHSSLLEMYMFSWLIYIVEGFAIFYS